MPPLLMSGPLRPGGRPAYAAMRLRGEPRARWRAGLRPVIGICLLVFGNGGTTFSQLYIPSGLAALMVARCPCFWP